MSNYQPPRQNLPVFDPTDFLIGSSSLTLNQAKGIFLQLSGGIESGAVAFSAGLSSSGQIINASGSQALPAYTFNGSPASGLYSSGTNNLDLSANNTHALNVNSTNLTSYLPIALSVGSAAAPSLSFDLSPTTGFYQAAANNPAISISGVKVWDISSARVNSTVPFLSGDGSLSAPGFAFSADTNTGLFRSGLDQIAFSTGGVLRATMGSTSLAMVLPINSAPGSVSAPGLYFGDSGTGMYRIGTNNLGLAINGTKLCDFGSTLLGITGSVSASTSFLGTILDSNAVSDLLLKRNATTKLTIGTASATFADPIISSAGTVSLPGISISGSSSGLYQIGVDNIGLAIAGSKVLDINSNTLAITGTLTATQNVSATTAFLGTLLDTNSATDFVIKRNHITQLTIGASTASFVGTISATQALTPIVDSAAASNLLLKYNGTTKLTIGTASATFADPIISSAGSVSIPSLILANTATGFYKIGTDNIGLSINGTKLIDCSSATVAITGALSSTTSITATTSLKSPIVDSNSATDLLLKRNGTTIITAGTTYTTLSNALSSINSFLYARNTSTQTISNNTLTAVNFPTLITNVGASIQNTASNQQKNISGSTQIWLVSSAVRTNSSSTTGTFVIWITLTSTNVIGDSPYATTCISAVANAGLNTNSLIQVPNNYSIMIGVFQDSSSSQTIGGTGYFVTNLEIYAMNG